MSKKNISTLNNEILSLKNQDLYSLILFVLFKLRDNKEYSTLSELAYLLDKDDFLNVCEYFGGLTIRIPTIEELKELVRLLILYRQVEIEGQDFDEAVTILGYGRYKDLKRKYKEVANILEKYKFRL